MRVPHRGQAGHPRTIVRGALVVAIFVSQALQAGALALSLVTDTPFKKFGTSNRILFKVLVF
jgi:hypothetical protein